MANSPVVFDRGHDYWDKEDTCPGRVRQTFPRISNYVECGPILDAGCSTGGTTIELAKMFPQDQVIGIDIDYRRITEARRQYDSFIKGRKMGASVQFVQADFYELDEQFQGNFYAVFAMNNLVWASRTMKDEKVHAIMESLTSALTPAGHILLSKHTDRLHLFRNLREGGEFRISDYHEVRCEKYEQPIERIIRLCCPEGELERFLNPPEPEVMTDEEFREWHERVKREVQEGLEREPHENSLE